MIKLEFSDIVYHKTKGKGVYLGLSSVLYYGMDNIRDRVEVIFEGKIQPTSVIPTDLIKIEKDKWWI